MCFIEIKGCDIEKMEGEMTESTMDGCIIQVGSIEHMARQVRAGGFSTGNRALDWALALHELADDQQGKRYVELEQRFRAARGEPVVVYVFIPRESTDPKWKRCELVSYSSCNEMVWLGKVAPEVPEPPIVWEQGEVYLPIERYARVECQSLPSDHPLPPPVVYEVQDCRLALGTLCRNQTMSLASFVIQADGTMHSIIRAGTRAVEGYFVNSMNPEQHAYRRALTTLGFPSIDRNGQRIFGL